MSIGTREWARYRDMPLEVELEIEGLRSLLNHYFPGQYPPGGISANDDSDDNDSDDDDG